MQRRPKPSKSRALHHRGPPYQRSLDPRNPQTRVAETLETLGRAQTLNRRDPKPEYPKRAPKTLKHFSPLQHLLQPPDHLASLNFLQDVGYPGTPRELWEELDLNQNGFVSLWEPLLQFLHTSLVSLVSGTESRVLHTYIHTYTHACMHTYIHACMHAYILKCLCVCNSCD